MKNKPCDGTKHGGPCSGGDWDRCDKPTTHTPGPWKWSGHTGIPMVVSEDHRICQASYGKEEDFANARLIAAAPDLLQAAYGVLESIDEHLIDGQSLGNAGAKLRAAIAKAEGRE